jgi:hypothetical protein
MDVQQYNATKAAADSENPNGVWAGAPSLAASAVSMKNTSGYSTLVDVSGGTVTVISVNGNVSGLTSGSFRLAPGDKIAITYSVAPNVGWSFDSATTSAPHGAWAAAPSLAASTVNMFNTSGLPVSVHVSAGTVTVIAIDGVTTGLTSGSFRLRRGGRIAITYSAAPTLGWVYA